MGLVGLKKPSGEIKQVNNDLYRSPPSIFGPGFNGQLSRFHNTADQLNFSLAFRFLR